MLHSHEGQPAEFAGHSTIVQAASHAPDEYESVASFHVTEPVNPSAQTAVLAVHTALLGQVASTQDPLYNPLANEIDPTKPS